MAKYKMKEIEAVQWNGSNTEEVGQLYPNAIFARHLEGVLVGNETACKGDYLIKTEDSALIVKKELFEAAYELAE